METLSIRKLEENYIYIGGMCGIYGLIFTFCLYDNLSGVTFPICVLATILVSVLFLKKMEVSVKKDFYIYAAGMLLLAVSTVMTGNEFFHLFNWVGILLLLMTAMIQQLNEERNWNFQNYVVSILLLAGKTITSVCNPFIHGIRYSRKTERQHSKYIKPIAAGVLCAAGILMFVLPLLVYSDQVFASFFGNFLSVFRFGSEFGVLLTFFAGFILMYAFLSGVSSFVFRVKEGEGERRGNPLTGITFLGILAAIYVFYCAIQILFLFFRMKSGLPQGVTYSQYANSGFWQLLAVSLINFVTVLICISIFQGNKVLKSLLLIISVCTCIMTFSAAYRMILYIRVYHLTFLRVMVLWFLGLLMLIMLGVMRSIYRIEFQLFRYIMVVISVCYIGLSFAKVDRGVAEYNVQHWTEISSSDMYQLLYGNSIDAAPIIADAGEKLKKSKDTDWNMEMTQYFQRILDRDMSLRSWNFAWADAKKAAEQYLNH